MLIKPEKLNPGDKVAAVTLSWGGPGTFPYRYEAGKQALAEEFDLNLVAMPNTLRDPKWIAENPKARADDLMQAFNDSEIKGIVASIGGEDSVRLIPHIDLNTIRQNPKVFVGYSDTTVSHFACYAAGLGSFYGPSVMAGFGENRGVHRYTAESFRRLCFDNTAPGEISPNAGGWTVEFLDWGNPDNQSKVRRLNPCTGWNWLQGDAISRGRLLGGCIEVVDWLRGTPYWPSTDKWRDTIVFLETSEESIQPPAVKRYLRALAACGVFEKSAGLLFGRPGGTEAAPFPEYDQAILDVMRGELGLNDLPIITGMDFGHTDPIMTLPFGALAEIDCGSQRFSILEAAVK